MRGDGDLWDYCVDDLINSADPFGLGAMLIKDDKGSWGVEGYGDCGASSGFGGSAEGAYQTTTAHTIKDLAGTSQKIGASTTIADTPVKGLAITAGGDKVKGSGYTGESQSVGASWGGQSIVPMEAHAKQEHSGVWTLISGDAEKE